MSMTEIGIIGISTMGENLALNIENKGYTISVFNRSKEKTEEFYKKNSEKKIKPYFSIESFISSIRKPRKIILMIKSGRSIDQLIELLSPLLEKEDILMDFGNSFYQDTIRRNKKLSKKKLYFIGAGISGGKEGALTGPSIMLGGEKKPCEEVFSILEKISASYKGESCISHIGPDGSGHYVKMIHNSIEYCVMQLIAESYLFMKKILRLKNVQLSKIFKQWNEGELNSYLVEITKNILERKDKMGTDLIENILDVATEKGTGKWSIQNALELNEPSTLIAESVFARLLSLQKEERVKASKILSGPAIDNCNLNLDIVIEKVRRAFFLCKIISHAQNFSQLRKASMEYAWNLDFLKIAKIFRSGCIIRSKLLEKIVNIYSENSKISNLLFSSYFRKISNRYHQDLRDIIKYSVEFGIPMPSFFSSIAYYDGYRFPISSANLIQAQRDYFGEHSYKRIDKVGNFSTNWKI